MSDYFTCPRCGGHHFGAEVTATLELSGIVQCHNADDGSPMDAVIDRIVSKLPRQKPCGWRGEWPIKK